MPVSTAPTPSTVLATIPLTDHDHDYLTRAATTTTSATWDYGACPDRKSPCKETSHVAN